MAATIARDFLLPRGAEEFVGEVRVPVELTNYDDERDEQRGRIARGEVRRLTLEVVVDTGASGLVLPEEVVDQLGLRRVRTTRVQYAGDRIAEFPVAEAVTVKVAGRRALVDCIVGPRGSVPLLGQVVLEITDLLVDCGRRRLVPDPASPDMARYSLR